MNDDMGSAIEDVDIIKIPPWYDWDMTASCIDSDVEDEQAEEFDMGNQLLEELL